MRIGIPKSQLPNFSHSAFFGLKLQYVDAADKTLPYMDIGPKPIKVEIYYVLSHINPTKPKCNNAIILLNYNPTKGSHFQ